MKLNIHLVQCLLHVQDVSGGQPDQAVTMTCYRPQHTDVLRRSERGSQQPGGVKALQPLAVGDVRFPGGYFLEVAGVD